ncbi:SEC-C metal-binding domain-containing protein [Oceanobacillus bengalensis]|uniref:SEC-C metal-binding domain-containing protein n=1 Tax=Oceanobacillus bengalensis TaxID=1435466 RepID=UPI0016013DC1|nr:SEC-C metal-binding domain-containing protein [Oceanobacillus bengalensis]
MKVGRNDSCPCGSGRKFKKCCLLNNGNIEVNKEKPSIEKWSTTRVEKLETEQIIERLASYNIPINIESTVTDIKNVSSASDLVRKWLEKASFDNEDRIVDFLLPAIKVLAKRLVPNHFFLETLEDWLQIGYELERYDKSHTVMIWWKAWKALDKWVATTEISSIQDLDNRNNGLMKLVLANWIEDFDHVLYDEGLKDKLSVTIRKFVAEDFLVRFPNSDKTLLDRMIVAKGESSFLLGEHNQTDQTFQDYANEHPNNAWIYIHWGDLYNPEMNSIAREKDKAIYLYKKAIKKTKVGSIFELAEDRLKELGVGMKSV